MTNSGEKKSRFAKLGQVSDATILNNNENNGPSEELTAKSHTETKETGESKVGLKFNQPTEKVSKKDKKRKDDQIKYRATINISEATRDRLKIFCATNKKVLQNWADEMIWKAMDRHEKALKEAKDKKE